MKSCTFVFVMLLVGCGDDGGVTSIDGGPRPDAAPTCPPQSAPLATGDHSVFVAFDGVTLALGECDDSATNCSSLVTQSSTVVPPLFDGMANRASRIATITTMLEDAVAPFSVEIVTTRPASGDYWMIVVGGTSDGVAGLTDAQRAVKPVCDATDRNSIALVFEQDAETTDRAYADTVAGAFGSLAGLSPTLQSGDCMCSATSCAHAQTCTWGTGTSTPPGNTCSRTTQNEQQLLISAVGCR